MRRSRSAPLVLLVFATALALSLPAMARTSVLVAADDQAAECPDAGIASDDASAVVSTPKPAAAKRGSSPAAAKPRPAVRGNATAPVRGNRWHRFLPGMFR